jgi:hypothetical protein
MYASLAMPHPDFNERVREEVIHGQFRKDIGRQENWFLGPSTIGQQRCGGVGLHPCTHSAAQPLIN